MTDIDTRDRTGQYAGPITRLLAAALDGFGSIVVWGLLGSIITFLVEALTPWTFENLPTLWLGPLLLGAFQFAWYFVGWATVGKTPAMRLMGIKVVHYDGAPLGTRGALLRTLVYPISFLILGLGLVGVVFDRRRRALHDLAARSCVVYDWERPSDR